MSLPDTRTAVVKALISNVTIAVAKGAAAVVTGSAGMLAEAIHSAADTTNQALLLVGATRAKRPASRRHAFGPGRETYFWSFVVALILFTAGAAFALYEGIGKLAHPHPVEHLPVAFTVLAVAVVAESWALTQAVRTGRGHKGRRSWGAFIRHSKSPELLVVLLEDTGALVGLGAVSAGMLAAVLTGDPRWDAVGSIVVGVLLAVISVTLLVETRSLLLGEAVSEEDQATIEAAIAATPGVERVIYVLTEHRAGDDVMVGAKVDLAGDPGQAETARIIDTIEERVRTAKPEVRTMFVEVDVYDPDHDRHDRERAAARALAEAGPGETAP